jgi:hypothetical protein
MATATSSSSSPFKHVRLPSGVDKSMSADVSLESMITKVNSVASKLPPLIPREWVGINGGRQQGKEETGASLKSVNGGDGDSDSDSASTFRVMQFNMLAEGLSAPTDCKPPFSTQTDGTTPVSASSYGGFSDVELPDICFDFEEVRRWRLLEEVHHLQIPCTYVPPPRVISCFI